MASARSSRVRPSVTTKPAGRPTAPPSAASLAWRRRLERWGWLPAVLLAVLIYLPTLGYDFTYDDAALIRNNLRIQNLAQPARYLATSWWNKPGRAREYRPATMASFALNYAVNKDHPAGYHAVNLLLHALNGALLWLLAMRLFRRPMLAFSAALIFALHPVHVEAVAGVVGRAELLVTAAFLLALLSAWASMQSPAPARRALWALATLGAATVAVFAKEHGVMLLPTVFALALIPPPAAADPRAYPPAAELRRRLLALAPAIAAIVLAIAFYFIARRVLLGSFLPGKAALPSPLDNPLVQLASGPRLLSTVAVISRYGLLLVAPFWPSPDYSYRAIEPVFALSDPLWIPGLILLALAGAGLYLLRRRPAALFGLLFAMITFLVSSNLFLTIGTIMADRLLYLPSVGFCLLLGALAFGERSPWPVSGRPFKVVALLLGLWCVLLLGQHARYLPEWRNDETLYRYMVRRMPQSARAHSAYASVLIAKGQFEEALGELQKSYSLYPGNVDAIVSMAGIYQRQGNDQEALSLFEKAHVVDPTYNEVSFQLAILLTKHGQPGRAEAVLRDSLRETRHSLVSRLNLGVWLSTQHRWREAIEHLEPSLQEAPAREWANAALELARCYREQGQPAKARALLQDILRRNPGDPKAQALLKSIP